MQTTNPTGPPERRQYPSKPCAAPVASRAAHPTRGRRRWAAGSCRAAGGSHPGRAGLHSTMDNAAICERHGRTGRVESRSAACEAMAGKTGQQQAHHAKVGCHLKPPGLIILMPAAAHTSSLLPQRALNAQCGMKEWTMNPPGLTIMMSAPSCSSRIASRSACSRAAGGARSWQAGPAGRPMRPAQQHPASHADECCPGPASWLAAARAATRNNHQAQPRASR